MKIISNNKGLSLVETLIGITVLSITGVGLFQISKQTILTSQVTETHKSTRKLKKHLYSILNNEDECKNNLKPDQLDATTGRLTDNTFKTLTVGNFGGSNLIKITRMALKDPPQDNPNTPPPPNKKIFYLYYKYNSPALGDKQKSNEDECEEDDLSGCYYLSCEMDYECTGGSCDRDSTLSKCIPLNCGFSADGNINIPCPKGKFLVGSARNNNECVGCEEGEYLIGTKISNGNPPEPICLKKIDCEPGKVPVGTKLEEGKYVMDCVDLVCEQGEHLKLNSATNKMECHKVCHGGQVPNPTDDNKKCFCPSFMSSDTSGNCWCPTTGMSINKYHNGCSCPAGQAVMTSGPDGSNVACGCRYGVAPNGKCWCEFSYNEEEHNCKCYGEKSPDTGDCGELPPPTDTETPRVW